MQRLVCLILLALLTGACSSPRYVEGMYSAAQTGQKTTTGTNGKGTASKPKSPSTTGKLGYIAPAQKSSDIQVKTPQVESGALDIKRKAVVATAKKYLGCKYKAASAGPKRFDCSGLTSFVFKQYGIELNRSSSQQYTQGIAVRDVKKLQPGDLVFWSGSRVSKTVVGHVGIVVQNDAKTGQFTFIHAALTGVQIDNSESEYYKKRYIGARRVLQ